MLFKKPHQLITQNIDLFSPRVPEQPAGHIGIEEKIIVSVGVKAREIHIAVPLLIGEPIPIRYILKQVKFKKVVVDIHRSQLPLPCFYKKLTHEFFLFFIPEVSEPELSADTRQSQPVLILRVKATLITYPIGNNVIFGAVYIYNTHIGTPAHSNVMFAAAGGSVLQNLPSLVLISVVYKL